MIMIPEANKLGTFVRYLRDHGFGDAIGDWKNLDGQRELGVRIGGVYYSVSELQSDVNREAVLARNFAAVRANRLRVLARTPRVSRSDHRSILRSY